MDALKTPEQLGVLASLAWTWAVEFLPRLGSSLLILVVGYVFAKWAARGVARLIARTERLDVTLVPAIAAVIRYAILIFVIIATLSQLGIQTASVLAALGAAGLALGLALQGTLSNIAAGLMLLWLRPFRVGERIEVDGLGGTVREIGLFVTLLDTTDGLFRFVPNSQLWNKPLLNYTRNRSRQLEFRIALGREADVAAARKILLDLAAADTRVRSAPAPAVVLAELGESGIVLSFQVWTSPGDFGSAQNELLEKAKLALQAAEMPPPERLVRMTGDTAAPRRGKAAGGRPATTVDR